ncbi:O-antigen ligase family protein [uncultured Parabacteroides sp.]|uniref:O-antigen ligase family protein n=1 Tax=uncultured Parabacteroides sp. TaxID=512312 RepID=UPI0025FD768A|nr:O-antigen ligase family protein [uncultured Parabacteroides sp.]
MEGIKGDTKSFSPYPLLAIGLILLAYTLLRQAWLIAAAVVIIPFLTFYLITVLNKPYWGFMTLFTLNYFFIGALRYINVKNSSVIMDIFIVFLLVCIFLYSLWGGKISWHRANNKLLYISLVWMIYVFFELFNPSAVIEAWVFTRSSFYNFTLLVVLTSLLLNKVQDIKAILFLLSIFTLIAISKAFMQRYIGFDAGESAWLIRSESYKTHLLASGTRYFSIFSDAGNFGSNMGMASIIYMILSFYTPQKNLRYYYRFVSLLAIYALMLSGTRGAMIVPLGGIAMFIILNKNIRYIIAGGICLILIYAFFAHTDLLNSNQQIRRMRTAFHPEADASYLVRKANQQRLAKYMAHKPFGEGVGLAGVENQRFSVRFTTEIPTDSHFVNIWVQFGVVGLCLHIAILLFVIAYSAYLIMFRIRNRELKGMLIAINCGLWGIMLSAYGNNFFWQYPTGYIVYIFQTFLILGESYDKELTEQTS